MKFIGQNIYDQISLFRNEVRVVDPLNTGNYFTLANNDSGGGVSASTITTAGFEHTFEIVSNSITLDAVAEIYLEASTTITGQFLTFNGDTAIFQSANADDPQVSIKNTNSDTSGAELRFVKDKGAAGADGDEIGIIKFIGDDAAQNQTLFGHIKGSIATAAHLSEGGAIKIAVASHDGEMQDGLQIVDGNAEDEIDVTIASGTSSNTTIAGNLIVTSDLTVSGTTTTIDTTNLNVEDKNITLNYNATGDTSSTADGAGITIQDAVDASNDASLTWVAATDQFQFSHSLTSLTVDSIQLDSTNIRIDNVAGVDTFTIEVTTNGATTLTTVDGDAALAHFEIAADGNITLDAAGNVAVEAAGGGYSNDAQSVSFSNSTDVDFANTNSFDISSAEGPAVGITGTSTNLTLKHTSNDSESSILNFSKDRGAAAVDNDFLGQVFFIGEDDGQNVTTYASITAQISESKHTDEAGKLTLSVAESDGTTTTLSPGLILEGEHATDGEVDVTIANGAASTTTIAGTLTMGSTAFVNNSGVIQVATQGTIDHDSLANFVAAEHYRWDTDISSTATIHTNNITDLHGAGVNGSANQLLTDDGDGTVTSESNLTFDGSNLTVVSATEAEPVVTIKTTHTTKLRSGELRFMKDAADTEDGEKLGLITFQGENESNVNKTFAQMQSKIAESDAGAEGGLLEFAVASHDGDLIAGLLIEDGDANAEADVTIAAGTSSLTTIAGDATVTSKLTAKTRKFEVSSATDGDYGGDVVYFGGTTSMTTGAIYHYKSDGTWELADADAASTSDGLLGAALGAASDTNGVLLRGMVTIDHDPGAVGDVLYLSTTAGDCSATAPSGNGDIVRIIGYQVSHASNGNIWFNPDGTFIEITA